ncbi:hypothetical protein HAX54_017375 [Datura stramonium]|uniref:TauD/TfdA-like domain-containing protein n=1 Tax=Datura stramonium TaxID=4076 RepID=A0ABS8S2G8_DATST|nr:hypothetical protein [Datura stramonium]
MNQITRNDIKSLLESLENNKEWFDSMITKNSAVLLRGFDVKNAQNFNDIVEVFGWEDIRYVGPAPRTHIYKRFGLLIEGPLSEFIYYHHEMVLIKEFPKKVILYCEMPPPGGENTICSKLQSNRKNDRGIPEAVEEIEKKGLKYIQCSSKNDKGSMRGRGWEDAFGTSDPVEAERGGMIHSTSRPKALGMEMEWLPNGGVKTILGPRCLTKVFDGRKGRRMWFNTLVGIHAPPQLHPADATVGEFSGDKPPLQQCHSCGSVTKQPHFSPETAAAVTEDKPDPSSEKSTVYSSGGATTTKAKRYSNCRFSSSLEEPVPKELPPFYHLLDNGKNPTVDFNHSFPPTPPAIPTATTITIFKASSKSHFKITKNHL